MTKKMTRKINTVLALIATSLMVMPGAFAAPSAETTKSKVTDARTEHMQFNQNLALAHDAMNAGQIEQAYEKTNAAKSWFLAFADSVALEKPGVSWDTVRELESDLIANYQGIADKLHAQGDYSMEQQVLQTALLVNPMQPEVLEQQAAAFRAEQDANDVD